MNDLKTFVIQGVTNPDIGFAVTVSDRDYEKAKRLAEIGLFAWLGDENLRGKYFPEIDIDGVYWYSTGYAESTEDLFSENGIEDFEIEMCFDEYGDWLEEFDQNKVKEVI